MSIRRWSLVLSLACLGCSRSPAPCASSTSFATFDAGAPEGGPAPVACEYQWDCSSHGSFRVRCVGSECTCSRTSSGETTTSTFVATSLCSDEARPDLSSTLEEVDRGCGWNLSGNVPRETVLDAGTD